MTPKSSKLTKANLYLLIHKPIMGWVSCASGDGVGTVMG